MNRGQKRLVSLITTALLVTTTAVTYPVSAMGSKTTGTTQQEELSKAKSLYQSKIASQKKNSKLTAQNDNAKTTITTSKLNPDDNVRLIVQLNGKSVSDYMPGVQIAKTGFNQSLKAKVLDSQSAVKAKVLKLGKNIKVRDSYYLLLDGFSVEAKAKDIASIEKMSGVKHVTIAREFYPDMNYATDITNVKQVWNDATTPYKGEGQVVAIIDTGIDMSHKDMKITDTSKEKLHPAQGFNDKVPYGYNFADNNSEIKAAPGTSEHGMHVAGIVAANGADDQIKNNEAIKGCAPEAQLLAMKVFSNNPAYTSAFSDDIISAIESSVEHKADVVNMSLGSSAAFQDPESAEQIAVSAANAAGTVCVISAGNSQYSLAPYKFAGVNDDGVVGSPGIAKDSLCVASYENTNITSYGINYSSQDGQGSNLLLYTKCDVDPVDKLNSKDGYELVDCGLGGPDDFTGKDLTGKIALVQRGTYNFVDKQLNAQAAGALGVIIYDSKTEALLSMKTDPKVIIPATFISMADGTMLKNLIAKDVKVYFSGNVGTMASPSANNMSDFTSWGPTPDLEIKPEVSAPGGNIWSTVNNNKYESMSGTSMASPHTAGIMALMSEHIADFASNNKITLKADASRSNLEKALVINTAVPQKDPITPQKGTYFSPRRQGAGLVDAEKAVKDNVTITNDQGKAVFALKEIDKNSTSFTLNLHNYGTTDVTYKANDLSGVLTEQSAPGTGSMSYDVPLSGASISFDKTDVTVPAGGDAKVNVTMTLPDKAINNYVEGYVSFSDESTAAAKAPTIGTTYMGYYGDWNAMSIVDAPAWDSDNAVIGETSLYSVSSTNDVEQLGVCGNAIDPNKIAFSTNSDAAFTNVMPGLSMLRNSKSGKIEVLDKDKNVIRTVALTSDLKKNILADGDPLTLNASWIWDGQLYNKTTNKMVPAADGQYYIRIENTIDYPNAKAQVLDMPVKVDSNGPQISDTGITLKGSNNIVNFTMNDSFSGLNDIAYVADGDLSSLKIVDINNIPDGSNVTYDPTTGKGSITLNLGTGYHNVDLIGIDYAGNASIESVKQYSDSIAVNFDPDSVQIGQIYNTLNPTISGTVTAMPKELNIAGVDVLAGHYFDADTMSFKVPIKFEKDGLNKISVYALGENGTVASYSLNVYADTTAPTLILNNNPTVVNTTAATYTLSGTVQDNLSGYTLTVNGQVIEYVNLEVPNAEQTKRDFSTDIDLHYGLNLVHVDAVDMAGNAISKVITVNRYADRLYGANRIETAFKVAEAGWKNGSDNAVLVSANSYADALVAAPAAKANNAPILLTSANGANQGLETNVLNELKKLNVKHVIIVGGEGVVSAKAASTLTANGISFERIAGSNRYETSTKVAAYMYSKNFARNNTIVAVSGNSFADGISVSTYAAAKGYPIVLVDKDLIPSCVQSFIKDDKIVASYVIGGVGVISDNVLSKLPSAIRVGGKDRYDTNAQIYTKLYNDADFTNVYIATGQEFADALSVSVLATKTNAPLVIVPKTGSSKYVTDLVCDNFDKINNMYIVGGPGAVSDSAFMNLVTEPSAPSVTLKHFVK